jgi:hypothetical protein
MGSTGDNSGLGMLLALLMITLLVLVYFAPTWLALLGHKRSKLAIGVLNLILGWSVIGWIIALVWAITKDAPLATSAMGGSVPVAPPAKVGLLTLMAASDPGAPPRPVAPSGADWTVCGACRTANAPTARFCSSCGVAIAR